MYLLIYHFVYLHIAIVIIIMFCHGGREREREKREREERKREREREERERGERERCRDKFRNALNANAKKTPPAKQTYFEWQLRLPHGLHLVQMAQISTANSFTASSNPLASLRDGHYSQWHGPSWPGPRQIQRPHMAANSLR